MKVLSVDYVFDTGSLDIYLAGCKAEPKCPGCFNPESWSFDRGESLISETYDKLLNKYLSKFKDIIKEIRIMGGDPLDQRPQSLESLLVWLNQRRSELAAKYHIVIFTRFDIAEVPKSTLDLLDAIKCGRYDSNKKATATSPYLSYGVSLASTNQIIIPISDRYKQQVTYVDAVTKGD